MKYTAVVSYKVIAAINVEADSFRDAVGKIRRKWHRGEMAAFVDQEPKDKTFNILGLSEIDGWEQLAKKVEERVEGNWQPTFENLRSFLSDNDIHIGTVLSSEKYHELIADAREWAGYPLGQWLMDCFAPYERMEYEAYIFDHASWDSLEKDWHERWP